MSAIRWRRLSLAILLMSFIGMQPRMLFAREYIEPGEFVFGGWAGYGHVNVVETGSAASSGGAFALGFRAGYAIASSTVIGLEVNGWTLKPYDINDPSKGESISNFSVFVNYFPVVNSPVYVAGGAGRTTYVNNSPALSGRDQCGSWFVGTGYEYPISGQFMLEPQLRYSHGNFSGGNYHVLEMVLGMSWHTR
jgi:hypothetical protein